jgi:tetratricopeptide (TPR) repeat protein
MEDDMHKLPSWNRVMTLRNVTASGSRPRCRRLFFDGCASVFPSRQGERASYAAAASIEPPGRGVWGVLPNLLESARLHFFALSQDKKDFESGPPQPVSKSSPRTQSLPSRKQLEQLLESDPDDVFLQYALAMACVSEGDVETGLLKFQAVIDSHPAYVPAYFQKGQALAEQSRADEARNVLKQGIAAAVQCGDRHAESEMREFLEMLGTDS